jgi:hypothetical protein
MIHHLFPSPAQYDISEEKDEKKSIEQDLMRPSINQISSFYPMKFSSFLLGSLIMLHKKAK